MLNAVRAMRLHGESAPLLPRVPELGPLYDWGVSLRQGQLVMIAGRSGSQKSGFALFLTRRMNLPTLYFSADMTPQEVVTRLAAMETGEKSETVAQRLDSGGGEAYVDVLRESNIEFAFGQPITWAGIQAHLDLWVEVNNEYPKVIVIDNLMDCEGGEADYKAQMELMQDLTALSRDTGATVIVLHHATDKSQTATGNAPSRGEIKNGMSEKPQLVLTVALAQSLGSELRVACVKQRNGRSDPGAQSPVRLRADPSTTTYTPGPAEWYRDMFN